VNGAPPEPRNIDPAVQAAVEACWRAIVDLRIEQKSRPSRSCRRLSPWKKRRGRRRRGR
jgi:hypothetical protein